MFFGIVQIFNQGRKRFNKILLCINTVIIQNIKTCSIISIFFTYDFPAKLANRKGYSPNKVEVAKYPIRQLLDMSGDSDLEYY